MARKPRCYHFRLMPVRSSLLCGALLCGALASTPVRLDTTDGSSKWSCATLSTKPLSPNNSVSWTKLNCTGSFVNLIGQHEPVGPMVFNVVAAKLDAPGVAAVPMSAPQNASVPADHRLQTVPAMAASASLPSSKKLLAGINGGYFWRVDVSGTWIDNVCIGKSRKEAMKAASAEDMGAGVGDSLLTIDGKVAASNCNCLGNSRPTALVLREEADSSDDAASTAPAPVPRIEVLKRGGRLAGTVLDAIGSGPNLVTSGKMDIPGDNLNIIEHSANTAVAVRGGSELLLITSDGHDGCKRKDPTCGLSSRPMATFLIEYLGVDSAMGMDQGGSTTMWVNGEAGDGVVSNPGAGARQVFDGLFISFDSA